MGDLVPRPSHTSKANVGEVALVGYFFQAIVIRPGYIIGEGLYI